jgi:hypothetical protein
MRHTHVPDARRGCETLEGRQLYADFAAVLAAPSPAPIPPNLFIGPLPAASASAVRTTSATTLPATNTTILPTTSTSIVPTTPTPGFFNFPLGSTTASNQPLTGIGFDNTQGGGMGVGVIHPGVGTGTPSTTIPTTTFAASPITTTGFTTRPSLLLGDFLFGSNFASGPAFFIGDGDGTVVFPFPGFAG